MNSPRKHWLPLSLPMLIALATGSALLALYQWMELLVLQSGGSAICNVNEAISCSKVWDSDFASQVHRAVGMPIAGLGLVWSLTALAASLWLTHQVIADKPLSSTIGALRVWAILGLLACLLFASAIFKVGAICLTCFSTYGLVASWSLVAFYLLPRQALTEVPSYRQGLGMLAVSASLAYGLLLYPGLKTPHGGEGTAAPLSSSLQEFLGQMGQAEKQRLANDLAEWNLQAPVDTRTHATRSLHGNPQAKVKVVEFTDILCGHCRSLVESLERIQSAVPSTALAVEPRYFPLDGECNPLVASSAKDGLRCLGAKVQICLEKASDFGVIRGKLFTEQASLTPERVWSLASSGSVSREELEACVASPATQAKLADDIRFGAALKPEGTPIVLLNGKKAAPSPALILALSLAEGNSGDRAFSVLPSANADHGHEH